MRVHVSLGSNLGDRMEHLRAALRALGALPGVQVTTVSAVYETAPWGELNQPDFLNLAAEVETELAPLELLYHVKGIEERLGRNTPARWGPRIIDIDLILAGSLTLETARLTLPHPDFRERAFVLVPLAEIAPDAVDPVTGKTVAELAAAPDAFGAVARLGDIAP